MADEEVKPDLAAGVAVADFPANALLAGTVAGRDVLLIKGPGGFVALDAKCTHSGAPLAEGALVGDRLRCPWHHACFDIATGAATAAPALKPLGRWIVEERDGQVRVRGREQSPQRAAPKPAAATAPKLIVIVGAGAAGAAAATALVELGHGPSVTLIGNESDPPYDRTALSKHAMAGTLALDRLSLAMPDLAAAGVTVRLGAVVDRILPEERSLRLVDGTHLAFDKLILATGGDPRRLTVPGADLPHVHVLRALESARALLGALPNAGRVVIVGGGFIGFEAAAALRDRDIDVAIVSPDPQPFAKRLGPDLASAIVALHRERGTHLHLGREARRIEPDVVHLDDGTTLPADLVIAAIGIAPRIALAEEAGLTTQDGVVVDERLRTSHRDIYAVGDIARWPDPHGGAPIRVEHWAVAQRQGQVAAANAAGLNLRYDVVPFFWTMNFDFSIRMVGHAADWDAIETDHQPGDKRWVVRYRRGGRIIAVATAEADAVSLQSEIDMERRLGAPAVALPV